MNIIISEAERSHSHKRAMNSKVGDYRDIMRRHQMNKILKIALDSVLLVVCLQQYFLISASHLELKTLSYTYNFHSRVLFDSHFMYARYVSQD